MSNLPKAEFSIEKYVFNKVNIDFSNQELIELDVDFITNGIFYQSDSTFELILNFKASPRGQLASPVVSIQCIGTFKFINVSSMDEIPSYFYRNAIALLFPYLRAYISIVTMQANIPPVILPTLNLSALEEPLRLNTIQK